jgi:hypothetical protein
LETEVLEETAQMSLYDIITKDKSEEVIQELKNYRVSSNEICQDLSGRNVLQDCMDFDTFSPIRPVFTLLLKFAVASPQESLISR